MILQKTFEEGSQTAVSVGKEVGIVKQTEQAGSLHTYQVMPPDPVAEQVALMKEVVKNVKGEGAQTVMSVSKDTSGKEVVKVPAAGSQESCSWMGSSVEDTGQANKTTSHTGPTIILQGGNCEGRTDI